MALWQSIRERETNRTFDRETAWAEAVHASVLDQVSNLDDSLRWNASFFQSKGSVSQSAFDAFNANPALHSAALAVLEWTPRVWQRDRPAYEAGRIWPGIRPYSILNPAQDGAFEVAPGADYYLPITYAYARSGNQAALGMNIAFSDQRRARFEQSAREGMTAVSGVVPIYLSTYAQAVPGLVRSLPIYDTEALTTPADRWRHLRGWISAVIDIESLFASAIDPYLTPDFDVFIYQKGGHGSLLIGYRSRSGTSRTELPAKQFEFQPHDFLQSITIGEEIWGLAIRPRARWLAAQSHFESNVTLFAGLLISAFVWFTLERQRRYRIRMDTMHERIKRAKQRTDTANTQLELTVEELHRTRASLVQSEKLTSLGFLVSGVSHELNTPLGNALLASTALVNNVGELRERFTQGGLTKSALHQFFEETPAAADLVIRSVTSAADLVAKFKQLSIEQASTQRRTFLAKSVVTDCVRNAQLRFANTAIDFAIDVPADLQMDSYPGTLEQVISQLISNSVVHGLESRGSGRIFISAAADRKMAERVVFVVEDDGCGIDPAHLPHLFDPFFTTKMGRNSGLGLNLVYRLVTQILGGELGVKSAKDAGTRFTLHLPAQAPSQLLAGTQPGQRNGNSPK